MIPYKADVMMQRWPIANWVIIGIVVLVSCSTPFLLSEEAYHKMHLMAPGAAEQIEQLADDHIFGRLDDEEIDDLKEWSKLRTYQFVTHSMIHGGFLHLFGNMLLLFVFGNAVNAKLGHVVYSLLYVGFAIVAGVAWCLIPGGGIGSLGASGAVMGVMGCFLVLYPQNEVSMFFILLFRPIVFHMRAVWLMLIYLVLDFLGFLGGSSGVANISHIAGMLTGAGVTSGLLLAAFVKPTRGEKTLLEIVGLAVKRDEPFESPVPVGERPAYIVAPPPKSMTLPPSPPVCAADNPPKPGYEDDIEPIDLAPLDDT